MTILLIIGIFFGIVPKCDCVQMGYAEEKHDGQSKYNFNQLLDAIAIVESNNNPSAVGDNGRAVGAYQIHEIYVDDVNRILGKPYFSYADRWDAEKSRQMVYIYLNHYGRGKTTEAMARIHVGGPKGYKKKSTLRYWQKIKRVLDNEKHS